MSQLENQNFFLPPAEAKAALFFLEGHYQLKWREGSVERTKFLSPAQIGRAFSEQCAFDSGWLEANVVRFAQEKKTHKILSCLPAGRRKIFITDPPLPMSAKQIAKARRTRFSKSKFRFRRFCSSAWGKNTTSGRRSTKQSVKNQKSVPLRFRTWTNRARFVSAKTPRPNAA